MPSKPLERRCKRCQKPFMTTQAQVNFGNGVYCGRACAQLDRAPLPCRVCGKKRPVKGRQSRKHGLCRSCAVQLWGKGGRGRPFALNTASDRVEAAKVWRMDEARPTFAESLQLGTMTKFGEIRVRGMRGGARYYVFLNDGVATEVAAKLVEAVA